MRPSYKRKRSLTDDDDECYMYQEEIKIPHIIAFRFKQ